MKGQSLFKQFSAVAVISGSLTGSSAPVISQDNLSGNRHTGIQDIIPIISADGEEYGRLVSFPSILATGNIPIFPKAFEHKNQYIDFKSNDAYTDSLRVIFSTSQNRIDHSRGMQSLLAKEEWTKEDRILWERALAILVDLTTDNQPGLGDYRSEIDDSLIIRSNRLNDLSIDIANNTKVIEYDCEAMSITEGIIIQQLENFYLGQFSGTNKRAAPYYYGGGTALSIDETRPVGHAFIISSQTGNIIEGTNDPDSEVYDEDDPDREPYARSSPLSPSQRFSDFASGKLFISLTGRTAYQADIMNKTTKTRMRASYDLYWNRLAP